MGKNSGLKGMGKKPASTEYDRAPVDTFDCGAAAGGF